MSRILVISATHSLLPFAHRLRGEGHEVEVIVWSKRFEGAWDGKFNKSLRSSQGQINPENLEPVILAAANEEVTVITDVAKASDWFRNSDRLFGTLGTHQELVKDPPTSNVRLGFWFDGQTFQAPHLLIFDGGVWPGGLGPNQPGALTLIRIEKTDGLVFDFFEHALEPVIGSGYRGLVNVGLNEAADGPEIEGVEVGWPFLHTHAFVAELEAFGDTLNGKPPLLLERVVTVIPVSIPPWPHLPQKRNRPAEGVEVQGLTPQQQGRVWWHDVSLDPEHRLLKTAGLDGLIGVVRGAAHSADLSRARALEVAARVALPQKQYRVDAGSLTGAVLAGLEDRYGVRLF